MSIDNNVLIGFVWQNWHFCNCTRRPVLALSKLSISTITPGQERDIKLPLSAEELSPRHVDVFVYAPTGREHIQLALNMRLVAENPICCLLRWQAGN